MQLHFISASSDHKTQKTWQFDPIPPDFLKTHCGMYYNMSGCRNIVVWSVVLSLIKLPRANKEIIQTSVS